MTDFTLEQVIADLSKCAARHPLTVADLEQYLNSAEAEARLADLSIYIVEELYSNGYHGSRYNVEINPDPLEALVGDYKGNILHEPPMSLRISGEHATITYMRQVTVSTAVLAKAIAAFDPTTIRSASDTNTRQDEDQNRSGDARRASGDAPEPNGPRQTPYLYATLSSKTVAPQRVGASLESTSSSTRNRLGRKSRGR